MWSLKSLITAFMILLLTGCGFAVSTEERDPEYQHNLLTELVGEDKATVVARLGRPDYEFLGDGESYFVYETWVDTAGVAFFGMLPLPVWGIDDERCSKLVFDAQDTLFSFELAGGPVYLLGEGARLNCPVLLFGYETAQELRETSPKRMAATGPQKMLDYGVALWMPYTDQTKGNVEAAFYWYCRAAHAGHKRAQYIMGDYYRNGWGATPRDHIQAYVWYSVSGDTNITQPSDGRLQLSETELSKAQSLAAEWKPNPAECEAYEVAGE